MGKIADSTKALVDAQDVMYWLEKHHVRYIFHGHKHIPCVSKKRKYVILWQEVLLVEEVPEKEKAVI